MQRKAQPFQVSLQIEERTLLVSDVGEGYSLDQSQGQMQKDYAKPDSMEGIIELLLYTRGSNPAICNLFLFFFSCWDRFPDSVPEELATTLPLSFLLKRQAIIQKSENDAVSMVPKLCARVLRNNKLGRGRALGCFKCFEGNLTSSGHHANDQLKEIHSVSSCYIPFHDIISLQSWVFSCCD